MSATKKKASRALHVICEVKGISRFSSKNSVQLYVAMVRPHHRIWVYSLADSFPDRIEKQRKALALCLSLPGTAALDALEVAA